MGFNWTRIALRSPLRARAGDGGNTECYARITPTPTALRKGEKSRVHSDRRSQIRKAAFDGEADQQGIRLEAGLGPDQIMIVLDRFGRQMEIDGDLFCRRARGELAQD